MPVFALVRLTLAFMVSAVSVVLILRGWSRLRAPHQVRKLVDSLSGDPAAAEGLIDRARASVLWRALLASPGPHWHRFHGLLLAKGLLQKGETALRHRDPAKRVEAIQVLRSLGVPKSTSLCLVALHDADPAVRLAAIGALTENRVPKSVDALVEAIASFSAGEREAAKAGLLSAGSELTAALELSLAGAAEEARMWVADFLGAWRHEGAAGLLLRLAADGNPGVRAHAATSLSGFPAAAVAPTLVSLLSDEAWFVRVEAAKSLALVEAAGAVKPLAGILDDPEWWVRKEAAQALYALGADGRHALVAAVARGGALAREAALETVIEAAWQAGAMAASPAALGLRRPEEVA